ncbi:sigma factor-like helix-turn-helix DNA-binding protein [Kitasatospora indigofera]|uniref:sigma factor-like helix-turn-helix DNA-binding protein n=1 Tax=Kitasatospora indigofera TaxID=67307 RepID=UPI0033BA2387
MISTEAPTGFAQFFERHHAELARLAHLLTGGAETADDLAADALATVRRDWERARRAGPPETYARRKVIALARGRARTARARRLGRLFRPDAPDRHGRPTHPGGPGAAAHPGPPDATAAPDVREALARLPFRVRACVVLRHAFGLSERQTARVLRLPVGAVRRRTSKGTARLRRLLGARAVDHLRSGPRPPAGRQPPVRPR